MDTDTRTFVIAEIGANHNRSLSLCKALIDVASEAGADATKFQIYSAATLYSSCDEDGLGYDGSNVTKLIESVATPREWIPELAAYCRKKGVLFFATPFDIVAVEELDDFVEMYKVASFEIVDLPLIKAVAQKKKPILISTGMASMGEIEDAVTVCREAGNERITLLQCASCYPSSASIMNLRAMQTMRAAFRLPVGLSDHTMRTHVAVAAVALGAAAIEKHITMDRSMPGPDHAFAVEPREFAEMVRQIREVESALGDGLKRGPSEAERGAYNYARRSIHALVHIPKGARIAPEMLISKRPGHGIRPKYIDWVVGRRASVDIEADSWITLDMLN